MIQSLHEAGHETIIAIKTKDVLERLLDARGWPYHNLYAKERRGGSLAIARSMLMRECGLYWLVRRLQPDLMIGTSVEITHVGSVQGIPSIVVNEDDVDVVPKFASLAYPFASKILAPASCRLGKWWNKAVRYEGYHELAYLHPNHFTPDPRVRAQLATPAERFFLMRFAALNAHHDDGRKGIPDDLARKLVRKLEPYGRVYVSSERPLDQEWQRYRYPLPPDTLHDALAFADLYVGDSQTMAAEAAVVGTPSIRFNDFVGEIGYLEELEHRYGLTLGIKTRQSRRLLGVVSDWAERDNLKDLWLKRRDGMLKDKVDVAQFMTQFLGHFFGDRQESALAA